MHFISEHHLDGGGVERTFSLNDIPGILWTPEASPAPLILLGPPGVGKTMTARWIASQLGMPMYRLDLAETIGRHLGESGNNIKAAFSKVRVTPGILFLDEIDAIAPAVGEVGGRHYG